MATRGFWIENSGSNLSTDEVQAGLTAAREFCATLGVDMWTAYRDHMDAIERGNENSPAAALWRRIEDTAIRAACADWKRIPDDLALVPA